MIKRIKRFYDYQKDRTSDIQPPYPLYHFILDIDSLCRSLLIAIWYSPINHSKRAYPFTGKSLYFITTSRLKRSLGYLF